MRIKTGISALLLLALLNIPAMAQEELEPPDVDFFFETMALRTDFRPLDQKHVDGFAIRGGVWFNALKRGNWEFAMEGALNWLGEDSSSSRFTRGPALGESPLQGQVVDEVRVSERHETRINGYEFGFRAMLDRTLYLRAGAFAHNHYEKVQQDLVFVLDDESTITQRRIPESSQEQNVAPYLQIGAALPLGRTNMALIAEYGTYWIDSNRLENFAAGLQFNFR